MNERDAFIRGIAANLYDDTPRLAFADWLDEHGEHDRAEFIRVQCELEPIRDRYEIPRAAELHEREDKLLDAKWLGAMPKDWNDWKTGISVEFRRGFPDQLKLSAKVFLEHGATIRTLHPTIRRVAIHCLNGWGEQLAACDALRNLAELELACWYSDDDMKALATSPYLTDLQVLILWLSRRVEGTTDAKLCQLAAKAKVWPKLRELVLLDPEGDNQTRTKKLVTSANRSAKRKIARYERGYPELFPLNGMFCYDFPVVGRLRDGRAAVLELGATPITLQVRTFDEAGAPTGEEIDVPLPLELANEIGKGVDWGSNHIHVAQTVLGFEPGFIRIQENALGSDVGPWRGHSNHWNRCGYADDPESPTDYNGDPDPNGIGGEISWVLRGGEFRVGSSGWANKTGYVHST